MSVIGLIPLKEGINLIVFLQENLTLFKEKSSSGIFAN